MHTPKLKVKIICDIQTDVLAPKDVYHKQYSLLGTEFHKYVFHIQLVLSLNSQHNM